MTGPASQASSPASFPSISAEELTAWLRLTLTPGVGNGTARKLLAAFGLPQNVFAQSATALRQLATEAQTTALQTEPPELASVLDTTQRWLQEPDAAGGTRAILTIGDALYPRSLLNIEDPPLMLYLLGMPPAQPAAGGAPDWLGDVSRNIAIVGSRNPTPQGEFNAREFAKALSQAGLTVVSGLALGVDGAAHRGALDGMAASDAHGQPATIAVVGTGLDRVYPRKHLELARRIASRGVLVSEFPLGTPALAPNFPKRNRIISGLSQATLVVEAALRSGSLITARMAGEQGKDLFAVPGSIHSPQSRGCHALIKQGAKLVESAQDVLEELKMPRVARPFSPSDVPENNDEAQGEAEGEAEGGGLLAQLGYDPVGLDALVARTGMDAAQLQVQLLELELSGDVARLPGGLFQRIGAA